MTRAVRQRSKPTVTGGVRKDLIPKHLSKGEFGKRLYALMAERRWSQSDLARAAFGINPKSGLPRGRDAISKYIAGAIMPTPKSLGKLADALGMDPEELLPNSIHDSMADEPPSFEVKQVAGDRARVWLQVNRPCSPKTAARILDLLNQDDEEHGA